MSGASSALPCLGAEGDIPIKQRVAVSSAQLLDVGKEDDALARRFGDAMKISAVLTRQMVSFQANKLKPRYRWFKYKEAFSADLVEYLLSSAGVSSGVVLDPFAGMGTSLFACTGRGMDADGVELMPVGHVIVNAHKQLGVFSESDFSALEEWRASSKWENASPKQLNDLRITAGAYPPQSRGQIESFLGALDGADKRLRPVLLFAALCVLEESSYTRKDGQFLRWDNRSGRQLKQYFHKGDLPSFAAALDGKIAQIIRDARANGDLLSVGKHGKTNLFAGSCLDVLPSLPPEHYDVVLTSPPYCNRYDYTRTYALELALLGVNEKGISDLRQRMLTCTVENRPKNIDNKCGWDIPLGWAAESRLLGNILRYLDEQRRCGALNNGAIVRMVSGYFREMACVIYECARLMKRGGEFFMVNDNVRYGGADISVDLILSDFAERAGLNVKNILVSPQAKGNSSQQMGVHGRSPLRKCVCVWEKA